METTPSPPPSQRIFWYHELPPLSAQVLDTHVLEAQSDPIPWRFADRETLWAESQPSLDAAVRERLTQELDRLGAAYAHVVDEHIEEHTDPATATFELRGRYDYVAYVDADSAGASSEGANSAGGA